MVGEVLTLIVTALTSVVVWFDELLGAVSGAGLLIAIVFIALSVYYILTPVLGNKSDKAGKKGGED